MVVDVGVRGDWKVLVGEGDILEVIVFYIVVVGDIFYLGVVCGVVVFVVFFGMGWVDLRKVNVVVVFEIDCEVVVVGEMKV